MKSNCMTSLHCQQKGVVLIISLVILVIITIIGISSMQSTIVEEQMATNMNNKNIAFQAAESTLRYAEEITIEGLLNTNNFNGSNGLYDQSNPEPNLFATTWDDTNSLQYPYATDKVMTQPRYMIRLMDTIVGSDSNKMLNIRGYRRQNISSANTTVFRVTARGTGSTDQSQVIIRSYYGRTGL